MKKLFILFLISPLFCKAQAELIIEGNSGNFYINHTAAAKESFYSIGRLYNASPKEIPPFNNTNLEAGISIGQVLKIPLTDINFIQQGKPLADEVAIPLYHAIEAKETLYQLSTKYNKVPVATLKTWNKLIDENVSVGKQIIVGYLKVKTALSAYAKQAATIPNNNIEKNKPQLQTPTIKTEPKAEVVKAAPKQKEVPVTKPTTVNDEPVVPKQKVNPIVQATPVFKNDDRDDDEQAKDFKGGIFKADYNSEGNKENGVAGIFKSTSGWNDGKYYCLYNKAQQYTIVKITNKTTGKFIYAKVLDAMPDLKQNTNLQIRVSNAASEILGSGMSNFDCIIEY